MTEAPLAADAAARRTRSDLSMAGLVFAGVLVSLWAALAGSAWLAAGPEAFWSDGRPVRLTRFCAVLALESAYLAGAILFAARGARADFAALRGVTDSTPEGWNAWERRFRDRGGLAAAAAIGGLVGALINQVGTHFAESASAPPWRGLVVWSFLLNVLLFAALGMLARWSLLEIASLRAIGRRVRVSLLDRGALAPFVRAGLRSSILWLLGSSLALLLMLDVNAPWLVAIVVGATMALGVAALLLPSAGINERLRAEKAHELAWVRGEIATAREALGRGDASGRLASLLAWESRVADASTWPFDAPTLVRFALLLFVPLASWIAAALVERVVSAAMGD